MGKSLTKSELEKLLLETQAQCIQRGNDLVKANILLEHARDMRDHFYRQAQCGRDAIEYLHERYKFDPVELAQLGVATLVRPDDEEAKPAVVFRPLDDLVQMTADAMKQQATVAKFRQLKEHFLAHQQGVSIILDKIDALARKNVLTTSDMQSVKDLRVELSNLIRRAL